MTHTSRLFLYALGGVAAIAGVWYVASRWEPGVPAQTGVEQPNLVSGTNNVSAELSAPNPPPDMSTQGPALYNMRTPSLLGIVKKISGDVVTLEVTEQPLDGSGVTVASYQVDLSSSGRKAETLSVGMTIEVFFSESADISSTIKAEKVDIR